MTCERWHNIKWNLAFVDEEADAPNVEPTDSSFDRLWKIKPVLDSLQDGCTRTAKPGRNVTLDEMMVKCTGELWECGF